MVARFVTMIAVGCALMVNLTRAQEASEPAVTPSTQPAPAAPRFPTPTEMAERLMKRQAQDASRTKVAYFDLSKTVTEKPGGGLSLFGSNDTHTLHDLLTRLQQARKDSNIRGVLITLSADTEMNLAQAQEIRDELIEMRRAGKKTFVYGDSYDTIGYTLASGATNVCLPQGGEIMIPGVGMETMFYKGTFDKVGVSADYIQIGEYKGAEEPYTRTTPSDELRGELSRLTESLYGQIVDGISLSRSLTTQAVREMIDDAMMTAAVAKERGFVDHLVELDGLRTLIKEEMSNEVELVRNYGAEEKPEVDLSNPFLLLAALSKKPEPATRPSVAVIYVDGVISDGDSGTSLLSQSDGVGSDAMRRDLRIVARDPNIKALVLRIDSPGGSALASEMIWQAVRRVATDSKKPVIISVGSMAASGGYYIASAGDYIFADSSAIVGSIGVVGGKFVVKDLFDKLGLKTETFTQGRNADLFSSNQQFNDRQRRMIRTWMQQTYDQFTQRVLSTRQSKIADIDKVARGRIFLARQARELGLVDEIGGSETAIAYAAKKVGLEQGNYDIKLLPAPKTIAEYLGLTGEQTLSNIRPTVTISPESILLGLDASSAKLVLQQIQMMKMFQQRPVLLMSPFVVNVK